LEYIYIYIYIFFKILFYFNLVNNKKICFNVVMGDNYLCGWGVLGHARYEPGNPSLNLTSPAPPPTTTNITVNTNATRTSTNVVVGAVVGGNFAQVALIILGILIHQGKVTLDFCCLFRKMPCWRKTEDELLEKMKDSGDDVEGT
jgi:hypothetical protein